MGWWSTLFNASSTVEKTTDAIISTGDKLFYTEEEKADDRRRQREFLPHLLEAYTPFKIAQRILAAWFAFLFGISFIIGLLIMCINMNIKYEAKMKGIEANIINIDPLFSIVSAFSLDWIVLTIIGFYFAGGTIESMKKKKD